MMTNTSRIRDLNDEFRRSLTGGTAVITPGIAALGPDTVASIAFCESNDPHEEHDFGSLEVDGHTVFFKIDYYDRALCGHSPYPADPAVTERVITLMLAEEY